LASHASLPKVAGLFFAAGASGDLMLVSIVIPAYRAEATIARALASLLAQSMPAWEAIIVSDDGTDYAGHARTNGLMDARFRFVSSGGVRSGCHRSRNVGLALARGDFVLHCDADDVSHPKRLECLLPVAARRGAAVDNPQVVAHTSGLVLYRAMSGRHDQDLDIPAFLATTVPLFPLVARRYAVPRLEGIENIEDVVANLRLIDRLGPLRLLAQSLSDYHVVPGSMSAGADAAATFDEAYEAAIERLLGQDGLQLSPASREAALGGLGRKRALNQAFGIAAAHTPGLTFQAFIARGHPDRQPGQLAEP
jgi:succinoglycan biosynthesis protein ExoO